MLTTFEYYQRITGDSTTVEAAWATAASSAQELLEGTLERPGLLESAERAEVCDVWPDGKLYPLAMPITAVAGGLTFHDDTVYGATPDPNVWTGFFPQTEPAIATITYTGGYSNATAPEYMLRDLAWVTYVVLRPTLAQGATLVGKSSSVHVGDVSVSYGTNGVGVVSVLGVGWSTETLRHKAIEA